MSAQKHNNMGSLFANPNFGKIQTIASTITYDPLVDDPITLAAIQFEQFATDVANADKIIVGCHSFCNNLFTGVIIYYIIPE